MPPVDFLTISQCADFLGLTTAEVELLVADRVLWSHHWAKETMVSQRHAELWREGKLRRPGRKNKETASQGKEGQA